MCKSILIRRALCALVWTIIIASATPDSEALTIDAQQQLEYANQLFENKQYRLSAEEYRRFAFFFTNHPQNREALFKSNQAFMLAGDFTNALNGFKSLIDQPEPDDVAIESHFMMVECYLNLSARTQAAVQLHNIITLTDDIAIKDRAYHRLGWLHIGSTDWSAAQRALSHISPDNRSHYRTDEVETLLEATPNIPRKSPALAGTLSIIPGAGQLYCRRYEDALIAFVVNVGLFWAASDAFDQDQPALGGLLGFIGLGFYSGNIYGAVSDAHKYNRNQQIRYVDQLNQYQVREAALSPNASTNGLLFSFHLPF